MSRPVGLGIPWRAGRFFLHVQTTEFIKWRRKDGERLFR